MKKYIFFIAAAVAAVLLAVGINLYRNEEKREKESIIPTITEAILNETDTNESEKNKMNTITLTINDYILTADLENNSSADALVELLMENPITIDMKDYANQEKVGDLGTTLPSNNKQITTEAGDLILYLGNSFVIYYAPNTWSLTRLGKIRNVTADELKQILGTGSVVVTIDLKK